MRRRFTNLGLSLVAVLTGGAVAMAHPGHGVIPPDEPAHWLEPVHFIPVVIVGLGVAAFAWRRSRNRS